MHIGEARDLFPGCRDQVYLDVALNGLLSTASRDAAVEHLETRLQGPARKDDLHAQAEAVRREIARLLGGRAQEVAITKNVSEGLNLFASSLDCRAGDNVVFCPELEHANNVFLWHNLARLRGVEVREVPPDGQHIPVERMARAMDERTRVVTASHVTFAPGFITDIAALTREAHARNALVLVDGAQSIGSLDTDVRALDVDAVALGTQKSLLAL